MASYSATSSSLMASFSHTCIHTVGAARSAAAASLAPSFGSPAEKVWAPGIVGSGHVYLRRKKQPLPLSCSAYASSDCVDSSGQCDGNKEARQQGSHSPNEILERLRRYGIAGILSYGLLNTAYYLTTFLVVWFYVAPAPGRMGFLAAFERFVKVMAMVWAGSQVTKILRAGGALALAPLVDRGLSWFTITFKYESQGKAVLAIAGFCFFLAFLVFLIVTLLCA